MISSIPVNPLFESELESRFWEAIRLKVGAANISDTVRNGKHSYYLKLEHSAWELEPQVSLGPSNGVSVPCKPDFVFWPVAAPGHKPLAVFTDGFLYHKDIVSDDTIKREALRRSGQFRVWSLSFKDVQNVFTPQGDYATSVLAVEKMPLGKVMYRSEVRKLHAEVLDPVKLSAFDLLIAYLNLPDAETIFHAQAHAYALSLLDPAFIKNNAAFDQWHQVFQDVNDQLHFTDSSFRFGLTAYGAWVPRAVNSHLALYAGISAASMKADGAVTVFAVLNDDKNSRTDKYEPEWNGFWQFFNLMQFASEFAAVSSTGLRRMDYLALPVSQSSCSSAEASSTPDSGWNSIGELLFDEDAKAFAALAQKSGIPAPAEDFIGFEAAGADGNVIATIEIAWPDKKLGFMTFEQSIDREKMEHLGWKIYTAADLSGLDLSNLLGGKNV